MNMEESMTKVLTMLLGLLVLPYTGRCDTIHLTDGSTFNGHILSYGGVGKDAEFKVRAKFKGSTHGDTKPVARSMIVEIEFNDNEVNTGDPPTWFKSEKKQNSSMDGVSTHRTLNPISPKDHSSNPPVDGENDKVIADCDDDIINSINITDDKKSRQYVGTLTAIDEKIVKIEIQKSTRKKSTKTEEKRIKREEIVNLIPGKC
jgi:hypothetical protein